MYGLFLQGIYNNRNRSKCNKEISILEYRALSLNDALYEQQETF